MACSSSLKQIADYNILHGLFEKKIGLLDGQMGMSIFFFYYSRYTDNSIYANFASELLDNVCVNLSYKTPITFADGLCGIGWGIELLKKEKFIDADTEIEGTAGKTIPEIFANSGEDSFRAIESSVLAQFGKQSGLVIATGGGCVTRAENYQHLHRNGIIIWIQRELQNLPTEGRPLSQSGKLEEMYDKRKPLYEAFADLTVCNDDSLEETVAQILSQFITEV